MKTRAGWIQTGTVGTLAALLRLPNLGTPHAVVFDETYYVKDAWSLWQSGYERQAIDKANELMLQGQTDILKTDASYVVHPPFGKWVIGLGEHFIGLNPFGWRIMVALLGVFAVMLLHRVARRLFGNELVAFLAATFMAIDGVAIVLSRTALLDQVLMVMCLIGFAAVIADRDRTKQRLATGKRIGFRWHLIIASIALALGLGTKWSAAWFVVACGLLAVFFTARARIQLGQPRAWLRAIWLDTMPYLPLIITIVALVYLATWSGWLLTSGGWDRHWAEAEYANHWWTPIRSLIEYHISAWNFHVTLTSPHSYSANPWTWPLQLRPTSFFYEEYAKGQNGCVNGDCAAEVIALGNPLIWWAGSLALIHQLWRAITKRESRAIAIVTMFAAGWMPWLMYQQRTVFSFYSVVLIPFISLALAHSCGVVLANADAPGQVRSRRALAVGGFVLACVLLSSFFLPLWTGETISHTYWQAHMWLQSWI